MNYPPISIYLIIVNNKISTTKITNANCRTIQHLNTAVWWEKALLNCDEIEATSWLVKIAEISVQCGFQINKFKLKIK